MEVDLWARSMENTRDEEEVGLGEKRKPGRAELLT
jgi:hypothetical protein